MPRTRTIQQRFTSGEIDPKMLGRSDIEQFYGAAETMTNVLVIPQGGFTRRPGLEHRDKLLRELTLEASPTITTPNGGTGANANDDDTATSLTTTTNISTVNPYVVTSYDLGSSKRIGVVRIKGLTISSGTGGGFYVQVSGDGAAWTSVGDEITLTTTAQYVSRRVQESYRYVRLARIGATDLGATTVTLTEFNVWTEGDISESRLVDFSFNTTQTYMLAFTDKNIAVYRDGVLQVDVEATDFTSSRITGIDGINWTQSADTAIIVHEDIPPKTLVRTADDDWTLGEINFTFIPKFDYVPSSSNPSASIKPSAKEGDITISASDAVPSRITDVNIFTPNGGTGANANDDDTGTSLTTTTNISTTDPYIIVLYDLGKIHSIETVNIKDLALTSGSDGNVYVQFSNDGNSWATVVRNINVTTTATDTSITSFETGDSTTSLAPLFLPKQPRISARYVRLCRISVSSLALPDLTTAKYTLTEFNIIAAATASLFNSSYVNQYIEGNGGRARVTELVSDEKVKATVEIPFFDDELIENGNWDLLTGFEDVWSVSRGWPRTVVFYEGRLWFGGSKSRPNTLWASRVNLFYDFTPGTVLDDDAIDASLSSNQFNKIVNLYEGRALQIFTTGGEYIALQSLGEPITPTNINIKRQSSIGSQGGLRPVEIEGGVLYIQKEGKSVQEFIYSDTQQAFTNNYISLLAAHLVSNPLDFAVRRSTSTEEGAYLLLVNDDGNLATVTILRNQNITAFTEQTTDGTFKNCAVDDTDMYFVVERTIDSVTERYLERFNNNHFMDASTRFTTGLPTDSFSGLEHLEGEACKVRADDSVLSDVTVASGAVTIDRDADNYCEVGLSFTPVVKDLPVEALQNILGTALGSRKNLSEVTLRLFETVEITVNSKSLSFRQFGEGVLSPLDVSPTEFTGIKRIKGFRGWDFNAQVTLSQTEPVKMTVLAISKRVNIAG